MKKLLFFVALMLVIPELKGQTFQVINATVTIDGEVMADNQCFDPDLCVFPTPSIDIADAVGYVNGGLGSDLGVRRGRRISEDQPPGVCCPTIYSWAHSSCFAYSTLDGDGTNFVTIRYGTSGYSQCGPDGYAGYSRDTLVFSIDLLITTGPVGFPVIVNYLWDHFGGIGGAHDAASEDPCSTDATLNLEQTDLLTGRFNFQHDGTGAWGWNKKTNQGGSLNRFISDTVTISGSFIIEVNTNMPGPGGLTLDDQSASQWGQIRLSVGAPPTIIPPTPSDSLYAAWIEFSVDIGGDAEMSDPVLDFNEGFDPGDIYMWQGPPLPPGGADGFINDEILNGFDPFPFAPDGPPATSGAPVASGFPPPLVEDSYLDIDGDDHTDFDLTQFAYGPGNGPLGQFLSPCVFSPEYLFISYDDDQPSHYTDPIGSAPSNSGSPLFNMVHGSAANKDEVVGLNILAVSAPAFVYFTYPYLAESGLHVSLFPDPFPFMEELDDDADALDIRDNQCPQWYFSVDHEAKFGLDPGWIYMKLGGGPGGGYIPVIYDSLHLGLPPDVDIDAFEFVWFTGYLCLLFSVADDDPATPMFESGGLDPAMIYGSLLDGSSFAFLDTPLLEDIDAITAWGTPLFANYTSPPVQCLPAENLTITTDYNPPTLTVLLNFDCPQTATYTVYSTTSGSATQPPPNADWTDHGDIPCNAGDNLDFVISFNSPDSVRYFEVVATCP